MTQVSASPNGETFPLPQHHEYGPEYERLAALAAQAHAEGKEVVVVMGVGFVGAVMAAIVADTVDTTTGKPSKFVIGCQRPSTRSYWKIPLLNRGESPVKAEDPEVAPMIARCVLDKKTLVATFNSDCLKLADCVIVDVQCDYRKESLGNLRTGEVEMGALEDTLRTIGEKIRPHCLVLIETTVAPGTTEFVAFPILKRAFDARGITSDPVLAHSFERVMPGREYVASIRDFWRVCAGCTDEARRRVEKFLTEVLNTADFPLTVMDRPIESETTKIVENSYRATILAFLNEWSLFAERNGVDLVKVIRAIKMRPTHSNMIFPGPGIGGYCLPKDGGLGFWAYKHILGFEDDIFRLTTAAIDINDTRGLHAAELTRDALRNMGRYIAGSEVLICGASYREDVGDTRYSGSELVARKLTEMGASIRVHDPYVDHWYELESQDTYPAPGHSWARFFRSQKELVNVRVQKDLPAALAGVEALVLAVRHEPYLALDPDQVVQWVGHPLAVVDCFGILDDARIQRYFELGCEVKALGRGHIQRIKERVRAAARPPAR
ncbi:MAG TPA: UDP binding domain-containing protein [Thermoanaerobaculaceae bacterium]|nr:UDP binding domain-containing protein [Thermoanaerobaculaceae bacterium]HRS16588.1 UDP binding domain-containing protein [Thermoanaerobaculaceae bacterium]